MSASFCRIPDVSNKKFPEAAILEKKGLHRIMYGWSPDDYTELIQIWNGPHPEDGEEPTVKDEILKGSPWPEFEEEPGLSEAGRNDSEMIKPLRQDSIVLLSLSCAFPHSHVQAEGLARRY